jgi:molybdopterin molybdotransferase
MISVQEALKLVLDTSNVLGSEKVTLAHSIGRILAEDIYADRPMPPFDRVTMDGIAILFDSYKDENSSFEIESICPAGSPQMTLSDPSKCIEIMTGASLPHGTDTIIRYEDLNKNNSSYCITQAVRKGQNIHTKGSDHAENSILLPNGSEIKAVDVNVLATVGKSNVLVVLNPKVAVISSGDELVDVDHTPAAYQIRKSNVHMISSRLRQLGITSKSFHFKDDADDIKNELEQILNDFDVLLMSGGVSKGKFDFIPEVLDRLGFEKVFHKVLQRPGKPFWFGVNGKKTVFAFPGNPVSTLACFHKYFIPWLEKSVGHIQPPLKVILENNITFKPNLTYFAQASISQKEDGRFYATVKHGNGSGDIVNPSSMDGFLELPAGKELYSAGELHAFMPFYPIFK